MANETEAIPDLIPYGRNWQEKSLSVILGNDVTRARIAAQGTPEWSWPRWNAALRTWVPLGLLAAGGLGGRGVSVRGAKLPEPGPPPTPLPPEKWGNIYNRNLSGPLSPENYKGLYTQDIEVAPPGGNVVVGGGMFGMPPIKIELPPPTGEPPPPSAWKWGKGNELFERVAEPFNPESLPYAPRGSGGGPVGQPGVDYTITEWENMLKDFVAKGGDPKDFAPPPTGPTIPWPPTKDYIRESLERQGLIFPKETPYTPEQMDTLEQLGLSLPERTTPELFQDWEHWIKTYGPKGGDTSQMPGGFEFKNAFPEYQPGDLPYDPGEPLSPPARLFPNPPQEPPPPPFDFGEYGFVEPNSMPPSDYGTLPNWFLQMINNQSLAYPEYDINNIA